jgi:hypothetical protein
VATPLRPLALGEIVDRAASAWRAEWRALFSLIIGFQLVQYALLKLWQLVVGRFFPAARNGAELNALLSSQDFGAAFRQLAGGAGLLVVVMTITIALSNFSSVSVSAYLFPRLTGQSAPTSRDALLHSTRRWKTTLGLTLLSIGWSVVVLLVTCTPGSLLVGAGFWLMTHGKSWGVVLMVIGFIAIFAAMLGVALWYILRFIVTAQVVAIEPLGAWAAFRRSNELVSGSVGPGLGGWVKGRLTVLITIAGVILLIVSGVISAPQLFLHIAYGNALDPMRATPEAVPQLLLVPAELLQGIVSSLFVPLFMAVQAVFYIDMRVRREGLDLELTLSSPKTP